MATTWTFPTNITQYAESGAELVHIKWDDSSNFSDLTTANMQYVSSLGDLIHISRSPKPDIVNKTYYMMLTGFVFQNIPNPVTGLTIRLRANRSGRVTDDTIQLCVGNATIGDNHASLELSPMKIYSGNSSYWGIDLTPQLLQDPSFGVVLRFKSHPSWPHKNPIDIDAVELQIY